MGEARTPDVPDRALLDRREFLRLGAQAAVLLGPAGSLLSLAGCARGEGAAATDSTFSTAYRSAVRRAEARGAAREVRLVAEVGDVDLGPLGAHRTWLYNGQFPGPELRVREGERLRVTLVNRLPDPTTIHWHGIPLPNAMDGVPGVTQPAVAPGKTFVYDYVAEPAGSYMYHSHFALQLDRGLYGPLVIEESAPHVAYDREYTLLLDDFLPGATRNAQGGTMGGSGGMMGGGGERMGGRGGMGRTGRGSRREAAAAPSAADTAEVGGSPGAPSYRTLLVNGRPPADPATFDVTRGQRLRLRILNPSSATTFRVAVAGHRMRVTHADGQPVQPVDVDALVVGMGERYDVVIDAANPGAWTIAAASVEGEPGTARAVLRYTDAANARPAAELPSGLTAGRLLALGDLAAVAREEASARADRAFDLRLAGGMMSSDWTIDGQAYPKADPFPIRAGERVRVRMTNMSMAMHPMHLHGHFFRVGSAVKDTVIVPPRMGRVEFTFTADNPGAWFFHCHNLYHMESGMARVFRYA